MYEEVNKHPLNQKALELLRSVGETPHPRTQLHILMLLEWLGNHRRREIKPEFPFDDILIDLRALPPERVMLLLMREQEERRRRKEGESPLKLADVDNMSPSQFEEFVGQLLKRQGYKATVIGKTGDMGVDVVAQRGDKKYAVQVKRYNQPVSRQAISDAVAGKEYYECNAAMVVTNSSFTKAALKFASKIQCDLVDRDTLANWIEDSHAKKTREATGGREQQIQGYILEEVRTPTEMLKFLQGTLTEWTPR